MRVVFVKAENTRYNDIEVAFDKAGYIENLSIFKQRCDASRNRVNAFLRKAGSVVWWGAGSASVILLNGVEKEVLDGTNIMVVDGDQNKAGRTVPGVNLKVSYFEKIRNKHVSNLVIASSFYKEIFETMKANGITYDHVEVFSDA
ncbi:hypothetical protein [Aeromonas rivipollensis]|uniref:hypothetical protein n=1 Tax=Aeromonas rivipollensis TaxID=948519 RepID=UPI003D2448E4